MGFFSAVGKRIFKKGKSSGDFETWMKEKATKEFEQQKNIANDSEDGLKAVANNLGIENIDKMDIDDLRDTVDAAASQKMMDRVSNPDIFDKMQYHKVPQKVLGTAVTLGVIHNMMSGGQQSNTQLYNQQDING